MHGSISILVASVMVCWATSASAFCGMYVSGDASAKMYNDATQVFLMRHGTHTVVTMRNRYDGPPADFAMLVPVPQVLTQLHVKTLKHEVLDRVQAHTAPRLAAYREGRCWAQNDPINISSELKSRLGSAARPPQVVAQFKAGEYDISMLSATQSTGLAAWLQASGFVLPRGSKPILNAYIQQGMYFFVAKVDPKRVPKILGKPMLSPLRFHYTSKDLTLPIRLGRLQSRGTQDLLVHVLAAERQEVANRPNAFIPTNLEVVSSVRGGFAAFYESLFASVLRKQPDAAVTEYAWELGVTPTSPGMTSSIKCDPCIPAPIRPTYQDFMSLGADLLSYGPRRHFLRDAVLTRLHLRLEPGGHSADLVFRAAKDVVAGVGTPWGDAGRLGRAVRPSYDGSRFQARYAILRHTADTGGKGIWDQCRAQPLFLPRQMP